MRKIEMFVLLITVFISSILNSLYTREGYISDINNDIIEITDNTGNIWEYESSFPYTKDEKVKLLMNNNLTDDNIYDDIIIKIIR
jgi:hypothetical protein